MASSMRCVFLMRHSGALRNFGSTVELLTQRGHQVHLAFDTEKRAAQAPGNARLLAWASETAGITHGRTPGIDGSAARFERRARLGLDCLRYMEPEYERAPALRTRADRLAPESLKVAQRSGVLRRPRARQALRALLFAAARSVPPSSQAMQYLREHRPDVVLVTPLLEFGSPQVSMVRAARALGIPTALPVHSWDNLTNKGLIHGEPDLVAVWNGAQAQEAVRLHGVPASRIAVTGAPSYDRWFAWREASPREEFCSRIGLDPHKPFVLYLCSSPFIAPDEQRYVRTWLSCTRALGGPMAEAGVLVRPHPQNAVIWREENLADLANVVIYPRDGDDPVDSGSRALFHDSIFHAAAVAGINTSALIESAILGRRVHVLRTPESHATQEGTLHFQLLMAYEGGFLRVADSVGEQAMQLAEAVSEGGYRDERFLREFLRPHGLGQKATPLLVDAIERLAAY